MCAAQNELIIGASPKSVGVRKRAAARARSSTMEVFYTFIFGAWTALAAALELTRSKDCAVESGSKDFMRFRNNYVLVYALMMGAPFAAKSVCLPLIFSWMGKDTSRADNSLCLGISWANSIHAW